MIVPENIYVKAPVEAVFIPSSQLSGKVEDQVWYACKHVGYSFSVNGEKEKETTGIVVVVLYSNS